MLDQPHRRFIVLTPRPMVGCGEGTVVMVNEAVGNASRPEFSHVRGFTPTLFDTGPLGVQVDGFSRPTGVVSGEMVGVYIG